MYTGGVQNPDSAALCCGGPAPRNTTVDGLAGIRVDETPGPRCIALVFGDLPSDVGNHRTEALDLPWFIARPDQGFGGGHKVNAALPQRAVEERCQLASHRGKKLSLPEIASNHHNASRTTNTRTFTVT